MLDRRSPSSRKQRGMPEPSSWAPPGRRSAASAAASRPCPAPSSARTPPAAALERSGVAPRRRRLRRHGRGAPGRRGHDPVAAGVGRDRAARAVGSDTINKVCASGHAGGERWPTCMIRAGEHEVIVAGGMESMSNAPYLLHEGRGSATRWATARCSTHDLRRADLAPSPAGSWPRRTRSSPPRSACSREDQDAWALRSHRASRRGHRRRPAGRGDRPGHGRRAGRATTVVDTDEGPRRDTSAERLAALRPVFIERRRHHGRKRAGRERRRGRAGARLRRLGAGARARSRWPRSVSTGHVADDYAYLVRTPAGAARVALERAGPDRLRRRPVRDERGVLLGRAQHDRAARGRRGRVQREGRRGRARPPDRRLRRAAARRRSSTSCAAAAAGSACAAICSGAAQGDATVARGLRRRERDRADHRGRAPGRWASGIAQVAAVAGYDVTLVDVAPGQLERAIGRHRGLARPSWSRRAGSTRGDAGAALGRIATAGRSRAPADLADRGGDRGRRPEAADLRRLDEVAGDGRHPRLEHQLDPDHPPGGGHVAARSGWSACTS